MKQMVCEMCGGTDLRKEGGVYVCESCGCKYSVEDARKLLVEGKVDVSGSTVKIDNTDELENLYQVARRAMSDSNYENAYKYYDKILIKDPNSWEASFYLVYCRTMQCKIAQIAPAGHTFFNCIQSTLNLIKDNVEGKENQISAVNEVLIGCVNITKVLFENSRDFYYKCAKDAPDQLLLEYRNDFVENIIPPLEIMLGFGDYVEAIFGDYEELHAASCQAWDNAMVLFDTAWNFYRGKYTKDQVNYYLEKIRKYNESYETPDFLKAPTRSGGCYVATAVYGSYDCPEVWTLRRYRDYEMALTWYGRLFIYTYYAISPTIVKLFGHTEWFKHMWKGTLDRMVENLQRKGFESTPYEDIDWK